METGELVQGMEPRLRLVASLFFDETVQQLFGSLPRSLRQTGCVDLGEPLNVSLTA